MTETLIGLGGRKGAGKDEVADRLVEEHGFVKLGMSDALHEAALILNPIIRTDRQISMHEFESYVDITNKVGYVEAKNIPGYREFLQKLGTEVGRNMFGENVWVNLMARKIDDHRGAGHSVVVTGIRFDNELRMIEELGGYSAWIFRPSLGEATDTHASENGVTPGMFFDSIDNTGTLEDLAVATDNLLASMGKGE